MAFVTDASMAAVWLLPDEASDRAEALLLGVDTIHVPSLFWFEVRNFLGMAERRGRIGDGEALAYLARLRELPIVDDGSGGDIASFVVMRRHGLSSYDAAYLALALEKGMPLATLDQKLAQAAAKEGIPVLGSLDGPIIAKEL